MIWTAIFNDKSVKVFSTQYNSADDAKTYANKNFEKSLFALIKGNHPEVRFF